MAAGDESRSRSDREGARSSNKDGEGSRRAPPRARGSDNKDMEIDKDTRGKNYEKNKKRRDHKRRKDEVNSDSEVVVSDASGSQSRSPPTKADFAAFRKEIKAKVVSELVV